MEMNRYWFVLLFGGLCEIGWVSGLKHADAFGEWALTLVAIVVSFGAIAYAMSALPVGTVYAVFTGIGAAGTVFAEAIFFDLELKPDKVALVILLIIGIAGLKLTTPKPQEEKGES
ncbi:DMT family transporter [Cohnella sp. GCM10027633]|uniref:DMT family transporter n=1 Tax=unclassified Cohnella TaxID=2636738 RepID=UPI00363CC135